MPSDQNRIVRRLVVAGMAAICMFVAASVTTAQTLWAQEIIVTTTDDDFDTNDGACSLREAVINANDNAETYADCATPPGADTIVLSAGTYEIDRTPGSGAASRDLDITAGRPITVLGASAATTVIEIDLNAHISARAFDVFAGANLTLADLTITGGNLPNDSSGAAVRVQTDASLTVRRVIFEDNLARDDGGAIDNRGTVTIYDSIFRENEASDNGGAVDNAGTLTVAGSLFVANDANDRGGAIHNTGTAEITNTTFSANRVLNGSDNRGGGAINNEDSGQMSLAFTSLIGNSANGSAIGSSITSRSGTVAVIASVIASDETDNCATRASGAITSGGYNIDSGSSCNFASTGDLSSTDPLVGALVNAGGLTDVHPLQANSPAIDIVPANTAGCGSTVVADQRGESRPQDGNADNTAACDAGAYEVTGQVTGVGGVDPIDVTVLTTVINSGNGPLSNPTQPLGPNPVNAGETYRFFVEIENLDPVDPAYGVIVHDTLLGLVGATVNEIIPADGWSCSFGGSQLLCSYTGPLLGNGQPAPVAEVTLTIDPAQPNSTITHYLQASTLNPDTDLTNNACDIADDCVTFDVQGQADLAINKRALTPSAAPGGFLLYEIEVINNGPSRLPSATVTDTISSGPGVVVAASPNCTIGAQTVCTVTDLEVGERRDLLVTVQVDAGAASGQSITNCATVEDVPSGVNQSGANQSCDTATVVAPLVDADLQVTSVNLTSGPFTPGAVERIELQVANLSAAAAQGVLVTFACDAVGSFEIANLSTPTDGTNPLWSHSSGGTFARIATLPGNSSETLAFDLRAPANAHYTAAGLIEDCRATVAAINPDPNLANNSNTIGNTFDSQAQANLSLTKTLLTPNVAAGGTAVYAVNLCNAGPSDVRGLSLVDTLGANLAPGSLVSSADLADLAVPAGQCVDVLITAQVTANAAPGTSFENSAQVTVDAAAAAGSTTLAAVVNQPTAGPVIGQVAVALAPADIQATNTITDLTTPIVAGQSYQFQIGIENAGPAQAQGVTVHDLLQGLPTGWSVTAIQTDPNWACSAGLTCTRSGAMPVKAETVATVTVQIPAQTAAGIYSHQLAAAADNPDGDLSNNDAEYPFNVVTTVDLGLTIGNLGQPLVIGGGALLYPVVVSNNGPSAAANVVVDVAVPAGLSLDALVAGGFVACTSNLAAGTGQCTIPTVGAGDAVTFYAAVRAGTAAATGSVQAITAEIASVTSTNNNLPVTDAATTRVDAVADVTVSKTGPASVTVGGSAVYNLIVSNNGPSPATGVRVTDTLPSLMGFVSATGATCSATGNVVTCAPFDLAAGTAQQITITASVAANVCYSGSVTNYVEVGGDRYVSDTGNNPSSPPSSANNQAQWTTQLAAEANLAITKSVLNSPVTAGGLAEFLIEITNNGPGCAPNVIVVDELNGNGNPEGLTQAAYFATESTLGDGNGPFAGAYYACTSGICRRGEALPAGMSDTIRILARVPADTTAGDYINQVNVFTNDRLISANPLPSPIVQTSVADFASCGITDDVVIVDNTGGEIQLRYQIDDDFDAGPLDANQWTGLTVTPPGPYVPTFDNGAVVLANGAGVSGARIRSNMTFLYRTVEGRVRFTDAFEQIVGFSNFSGSWAVISTYRDTSRLHAWSNGPDGEQVTPLPFSIDPFAFHDYRVVWGDSAIEYWIDGVLVATHNRAITTPMFAHVTNWYGQGTQVVTVDNMRVLDYATPGQFTSCAIDAREPVSWTNLSWLGQTPTDTALQAAVRTSDDGATWSAWTPVTNGGGSSDAPARYLQYRFDFSAANTLVTPRLDEVSIGFERPGGQPATINLASAYATAPWTVTTAADLAIAKTLLTPGTVAPGGLLQYEIVVTNDGPSVATGINVTDTLTAGFPAGTQIVAASPECTGAPGTQITCAVDNLWPGQSLDFLVTVRVGIAAANGATIENCAAVNDLPNGINQACAASATVGNLLPNADIEIISMSCSPVLPGSPDTETVCSVTFNNSGPATASNVTLAQRAVNVIPQGQSFSAVTSQQSVNVNTLWLCSTGMDCTRTAPMPAGTTDTVTLHFRTLPDAHLNAFDGRPIRVEASVTASNPDASLFNNRVIVAPDVQPSANLRVDKVALTENPAPGGAALFAVTVYNDGFSDVAGVAIDDVITTGNATILSVSPAGTAYIAAGSSQQFLVAVQVDDDALPGDTVTNQATVNVLGVDDGLSTLVTATGYNGTINDPQTDTASITVGGQLPDADISAGTITNNTAPIVAGGLYSFTVSVSNAGPAQAQGVVVHNLLLDLPGATLVNVTPAPNWFCSGDLTCTRQDPLLPQISETVATVTVTIPANTPAGIYRHRLAASSSNPDPVLSNNSTEAYTFEVTTAAALTITVDDLDEPLVAGGAPVIYPIQVYNSGPSDAYDVDLTVTLQPGFVLVSLDEGDLPMTCAVGTASCTVPSVPAGGSRTLYAGIRAAASAPPTLPPAGNSPVVEVCITDAANAATPVCDSENTRVDARADLVLSKQASATVNAGDTITYTVDVFNAGPSDAQNVQVIDTLPAGVTVENADLCTENAGVLTCPAISLAAGTSQRYSFLVRTDPSARPGSSLENVAEVTSDTADLNTLNNRDDADTSIVSLAALSVTKTPSAATVNAGESIRFDIIVTNAGPSTAQNVTVEDALPAGLSLVEASVDFGGGVQPCGGVVCGVGDLAAGAFATVRITALAAADLAAGTTLTNVAQVNSDSAENDLADNRAEAPVTVTTQAQITVSKTDLLDPVVRNDAPGVDDLAYVLTVANNGPSAAASVRVTDTLPTGVVGEAFVLSASWAPGPQPGTCSGAGELVCELGAIPAGEQVQIYVRADIQDPLLCDADVTNQAAAAWTDSRGALATSPVSVGTAVLCSSDIDIVKSGPETVSVGGAATYVVTVTNTGPAPLIAGQLTLADATPVGLTFNGISAQSGACAFSGASPWTNTGTLAVGESCSVTLGYTVTAAACPAGVLFNRAQATTQTGDTDQAVAVTAVGCDTSLDIDMTPLFLPEELVAGTIVDFEITVENTGNITAYDVELTGNVYLPQPGARIVDFFPESAFSAGECTNGGFCNLGDLPAGESVSVIASVEIDPDQALYFPNFLVKDACAEAGNADPICLADREQIFEELILGDAELSITKQTLFDPIVVSSGYVAADGYYVLEVRNEGFSDAAPGVVISDTLPLGMVISGEPVVTASYGYGDIGLDCSGSVGNGVLSCVLDNPLPAWETLQIVVPVGFEAATAANFCVSPGNSFNNVAQVLWTDDVDIEQSALSNAVTSNFICRGDVDVIKSGPAAVTYAEAAAGFAYTVTVQNTGPSPIAAGGVTVTDVLPTGLFFDAAAAVNGGACGFATTAQTGDGVVVFTNATPLGAGESCTVTFGVTSAPSGQTPDAGLYTAGDLFNVVTVRAGSDVAQAVAQTQIDFSTQLTITKQALGPVVAGAEAIFEIVITNTGDAPAFDLLLTDNANARSPIDPLGAQIVGMSIVGEPAGLCTDGGLCRIDTLAAKDSITVLATVLVDADTLSSEARQQACVAAANAPSTCAAVSAEIERVTDVRIRKDDLGNVLVAGGAPVQYIITVWNENGPSTAYDVVVRDEMLPGFTLVGDLEPGSQRIDCPDVPNAGDNVCIIRALRPGDSVELYATVAAAADAVDAVETPVNQACVVEIDGVAPVNPLCDSESSNVITRADLALVKNAPATVSAGDPITYTIDVVNLGPSNAQNVTVADVLPPQLSAVSIGADQGGCSSLPCALGMLPAGASAVITINAIVDNAVLVGSSIENVATVSTSTIDPNPTNDSDDADTSVVGSADLSLSKRGPATITAGTEIEYTITITNNGPSTAPGVNVNDALPVGMTLVEATIQRSGNGLQLCGGLVCQLDKMAVGETAVVTLRALVSPNLTAGTVLTNTATIFGVTEDTNTANNSASVVTVVGSVADVAVSVLDLSDPVQPTGGFVYDIAVTNNGPSMARGVVLTDVLDANVTFSSMSPACPLNGDTLTCNVGNLRVGDTVRFLLAVTAADVPNGTQLVNTATVTTSTTDPVAENNVDSEFTTVQLGFGPSADVSVSKSTSTALVNAGEFVTYTMIVSNAGPVEATDVKLIEVIPAGTRLVAITVDNPSFASATCSLSGICLLGTLPVGVNATVTARLLVETSYADTVVNNLVTVLADQIDPQPRNNIDLAAVAVNPFVPLPSVQVTKELARTGEAADGVVPVGERITFTITLANDGELQIVDMPLIDTYDATKLSFVSASTPPSSVAPLGTLLWDNLLPDVLSLAPGDSFQVVTVFDTVGSSATSIDGLTENTATVNAAEGQNGETAPAVSDTATIRVTAPGVAIRKEVDASTPAVVLPGDLITYSITVSNTGDTRLTTVPVIDRFDADHLTFVSAQIPPTSTAAEEIRWADVGDIEPGEALSFTVTFRVTGDVPFVDNVAVLGIVGDENGDTALDSSGQTLVEVGVARLGFELDSLPAPGTEIRPGDVVTYYLRLVNRGGIPLTNVTLVTQVPEGTTLLRFEDVPAARSTPNESAEQDNVYEWQFGTMAVNEAFQTLMIVQVNQDTTLQVISMDAAYSSAETAAGQSNELTHPLSPTAITLEYFTVEQKEGGVLVRWKTAAEVNSWGFYVLRSEYGKNERTRVNPTLIPATGAGSVYEYFDTGAGSGQVYEYWLQEIELDGDVLEYGPTVVGSGVERVYLPIVER